MNDLKSQSRDDDLVGELLILAGEPAPVPEEAAQRIKGVVKQHWQQQVSQRRRRRFVVLAVAASAVLAAGLGRWMIQPTVIQAGQFVASVERTSGTAQLLRNGQWQSLTSGVELLAGDEVTTGQARLSLGWESGHDVRLNLGTRIRVVEDHQLTLETGQVYVQGPGLTGPLTVNTAVGPVRDIGTQFMVTANAGEVDIKVREGEISLVRASGEVASVTQGFGLTLALADDDPEAEPVPLREASEEWDWAFEVAPVYDINGRTVDDFVRWLAREKNWQVTYTTRAARRLATSQRLKGRLPADSTPQQWLQDVLKDRNLKFSLRGRMLRIEES